MDDNAPDIQVLSHPLRRKDSGPSDIEWALLLQRVAGMEKALETLTDEVKRFATIAMGRCENCEASRKFTDHETRIRDLEKMVWKAVGIAAVGATLLTFAMNKIFK